MLRPAAGQTLPGVPGGGRGPEAQEAASGRGGFLPDPARLWRRPEGQDGVSLRTELGLGALRQTGPAARVARA